MEADRGSEMAGNHLIGHYEYRTVTVTGFSCEQVLRI